MKDKWLYRVLFWLGTAVPLYFVALIGSVFGSTYFVISLVIYILIYRPIVHILRLLQMGAIEEKDAWKFFIPFYGSRYTKTMFFG